MGIFGRLFGSTSSASVHVKWDVSRERMDRLRQQINPIVVDRPLRQVLSEHFPRDCSNLPITGGWGYSQAEAIVFVRDLFPKGMPRDAVGLEYHIAQKIAYEETIIFQPKEIRFSGIQMKLQQQHLIRDNQKKYDRLDFSISCWSDFHWEALKQEWEENDFGERAGFDVAAHVAKREAAMVCYERTFWFDITDVFGR
jgi:hypothetical protein